jgi:hypothetical protein
VFQTCTIDQDAGHIEKRSEDLGDESCGAVKCLNFVAHSVRQNGSIVTENDNVYSLSFFLLTCPSDEQGNVFAKSAFLLGPRICSYLIATSHVSSTSRASMGHTLVSFTFSGVG